MNNDGFPGIYFSNDFHENDYLYINNGNGTFSERLTDFIAHTCRSSMGNDVGDFNNDGLLDIRNILVRDLNQDGRPDLVLAGNNYLVRPSLGRYDATYGWCLIADGTVQFKPLMPVESGLIIKGDARKLRTITIQGKTYLVAGINNSNLQIFRF
ncbi:MAG: VCBS repeat-containing protein [Bacteroidota bacterium]|nr:VCBS repeat-containing protein [Bacteroidota bacterium]